tara:strand:- start:2625 stop:2993 length:369 start_codon:yes stop_codon:yes gene_type:complete
MEFKLNGTVELVQAEKQISDSFRKRDVIINTGGDYPQSIQIQFVNDMVDESGMLVQGMEVEIDFNLRGRAWENPKTGDTMYFNTLQGWKIATVGGMPLPTPKAPQVKDLPKQNVESDGDLPF